MYACRRLIGLGVAAYLMAAGHDLLATPLQSALEIPQMGEADIDLGTAAPRAAVDTVVDFSAVGGLAGGAPLAPVGDERLLVPLQGPDPAGMRQPFFRPGASSPETAAPTTEIFREIIGDAARSGPVPVAAVGRSGRASEPVGERETTLRDLVRMLINRPETLGLDEPVAAPRVPSDVVLAAAPQGEDHSILNAILSITVDKEIIQAISSVLRPSIDLHGIVALNIFGLREVALVVSPGSNSVRMIDLATGRSMAFRYEERGVASMDQNQRRGSSGKQREKIDRENLLPSVLASIRLFLETYVFTDVTLVSLLGLMVFWTVWRFARHE